MAECLLLHALLFPAMLTSLLPLAQPYKKTFPLLSYPSPFTHQFKPPSFPTPTLGPGVFSPPSSPSTPHRAARCCCVNQFFFLTPQVSPKLPPAWGLHLIFPWALPYAKHRSLHWTRCLWYMDCPSCFHKQVIERQEISHGFSMFNKQLHFYDI